jgi:hypothetical protein
MNDPMYEEKPTTHFSRCSEGDNVNARKLKNHIVLFAAAL